MRFRNLFDIHSLRTQLILSFIFLVLITALATEFPAVLLIYDQQKSQAWAMVDQGTKTARIFYDAKQSELEDLATLTAQRPTLIELLAQGSEDDLISYLTDLQKSAGFDLVSVCILDTQLASYPDGLFNEDVCEIEEPQGYYIFNDDDGPQAWMLHSHNMVDDPTLSNYVVVGISLDRRFAEQMRAQTGLEHTLLLEGQPIATSLSSGIESLAAVSKNNLDSDFSTPPLRNEFNLEGQPYFAAKIPLSEISLNDEIALAVGDIHSTRRRLFGILIASIIVVTLFASILGAFLARRISQPLEGLADLATSLSKGDLSNTASVETQVREVVQVSQALEGARYDLQRTLNSLRKEIEWGDHLLDSIVEGIVTLDDSGRVTFFSSGAERITGWLRADVLNHNIDDVFKLTEHISPFSQLIPPPGRKQILTVDLADGRDATLAITGAQLLPSKADEAQVALVFRDVSEEEAMHRLLGHFMSNVAHEFRTPLSSLAASIELLMDQAPDLSSAEIEELLTSLHLGILGLHTLVDNLLESASIEAGRFRVSPRPCDLGNIIGDAVITIEPLLYKYGQRLVVELPITIPSVYADPRRTVQVMVNLLSNANKYGPENEEIRISAEIIDGWVRVSVSDRGLGIPKEYRDSLFQRFVRPGNVDDNAKAGAGLGLSVVKAIVEAQGGQVGVDDNPERGAQFWFTLQLVSEG
jgi:PAS domain S-box-containing protein